MPRQKRKKMVGPDASPQLGAKVAQMLQAVGLAKAYQDFYAEKKAAEAVALAPLQEELATLKATKSELKKERLKLKSQYKKIEANLDGKYQKIKDDYLAQLKTWYEAEKEKFKSSSSRSNKYARASLRAKYKVKQAEVGNQRKDAATELLQEQFNQVTDDVRATRVELRGLRESIKELCKKIKNIQLATEQELADYEGRACNLVTASIRSALRNAVASPRSTKPAGAAAPDALLKRPRAAKAAPVAAVSPSA